MATKVGTITHWYDKIGVAVIKLTGALKKGDRIKVEQGDEVFEDSISSLQIDHEDVESAKKGDEAAVKLAQKAKEGATISVL